MNRYFSSLTILIPVLLLCQCRSKVKERKDELYSRHLQKKIALVIYNTPVPENTADFNLLLLNDQSAFDKIDFKEILKALVAEKSIAPLLIVSFDTDSKYFAVDGDGKSVDPNRDAEKFQDFMVKELIPFAKKKSGARKFNSIVLAGYGKSAIPVWDAAWDHAATYQKVGIFEPAFESMNDTTLLYQKITPSRKRPKTSYWIWTRKPQEKSMPLNLLVTLINKKVSPEMQINKDAVDLKDAFTDFLKWAFPGP